MKSKRKEEEGKEKGEEKGEEKEDEEENSYFQFFKLAWFPDSLNFTYSEQFRDGCPEFYALVRGISGTKPILSLSFLRA